METSQDQQVQLGVRVPRDLFKRARIAAMTEDMVFRAFVIHALETALVKHNRIRKRRSRS